MLFSCSPCTNAQNSTLQICPPHSPMQLHCPKADYLAPSQAAEDQVKNIVHCSAKVLPNLKSNPGHEVLQLQRIFNEKEEFQKLLQATVFEICLEIHLSPASLLLQHTGQLSLPPANKASEWGGRNLNDKNMKLRTNQIIKSKWRVILEPVIESSFGLICWLLFPCATKETSSSICL